MRTRILCLVLALVACASPLAALAQPAPKVYRIGFIGNSTAALESNLVEPWRDGLRELGYVEGRDLVVEYRWAQGDYGRFPALVAELIALKVDVLVTAGTPAALAVKRATKTIPLVMVAVGDPVGTGLAASLARAGGNLTGLVSIAPDLEGKRLELLREVVPKLSHVSVLTNPANPFHVISEKQVRAAAGVLHMKVQFVSVRAEPELDHAFDTIARERPGGLIMLADRVFLHNRARIADFATRNRFPGVRVHGAGGGRRADVLRAELSGMHKRAAYFVGKILKGAKPADLPMEQPAKFELVVNLKTAKALGLTIPQSLLLRADRLIE